MKSEAEKKEGYKWAMYFTLAVVLAIFGMVIYITVQEQSHNDRYWVNMVFSGNGGLPTFPTGNTGTLNGGIRTIRDAVSALIENDVDVTFKVPAWGDWKLTIVPEIPTGGGAVTTNFFIYSFQAPSNLLNDVETILDNISRDAMTTTDLFGAGSTDLTWANAVPLDANINATLTFGTRDTSNSILVGA
jgi:hypothetical protein